MHLLITGVLCLIRLLLLLLLLLLLCRPVIRWRWFWRWCCRCLCWHRCRRRHLLVADHFNGPHARGGVRDGLLMHLGARFRHLRRRGHAELHHLHLLVSIAYFLMLHVQVVLLMFKVPAHLLIVLRHPLHAAPGLAVALI